MSNNYSEKDFTRVELAEPFEYPVANPGDTPKTIKNVEFVHPNRMTLRDLDQIRNNSETEPTKYVIEAISLTIRNADTGMEIPPNVFSNFRAFHLANMIDVFTNQNDQDEDPNG